MVAERGSAAQGTVRSDDTSVFPASSTWRTRTSSGATGSGSPRPTAGGSSTPARAAPWSRASAMGYRSSSRRPPSRPSASRTSTTTTSRTSRRSGWPTVCSRSPRPRWRGCGSCPAARRPTRRPCGLPGCTTSTAGEPERWRVISPAQAYHGSTMGTLALTGRRALQEPYTPYLASHLHLPPIDVAVRSDWRGRAGGAGPPPGRGRAEDGRGLLLRACERGRPPRLLPARALLARPRRAPRRSTAS